MTGKIRILYIEGAKYMLLPYGAIDDMFNKIRKHLTEEKLPLLSKMALTISRRKPTMIDKVLYFAISTSELKALRNMLEITI